MRFSVFFAVIISATPITLHAECVVLLHGLARTSASMQKMATAMQERGYTVVNVDYPSREHEIAHLAPLAVNTGVASCPGSETVHFITHSLDGILIRYYLERHEIPDLGRVVMLAPPNHGSEVVDNWRNVPGFSLLNGPAGLQLGTDEASIPRQLGPVSFELGIIAGTKTFNPLLSLSLPNPDDGKVSVESTKITGMSDFIAVPYSHPFILYIPFTNIQLLPTHIYPGSLPVPPHLWHSLGGSFQSVMTLPDPPHSLHNSPGKAK